MDESKVSMSNNDLKVWSWVLMTIAGCFFGFMFFLYNIIQATPTPVPVKQGEGIFSNIKVGDVVGVKEVGERYKILVDDKAIGLTSQYTVTELGRDFIQVKNPAGMITSIPVTSIIAVVTMKLGLDGEK